MWNLRTRIYRVRKTVKIGCVKEELGIRKEKGEANGEVYCGGKEEFCLV